MKSRIISTVFLLMLFCMFFTKTGFADQGDVLYKGTLGGISGSIGSHLFYSPVLCIKPNDDFVGVGYSGDMGVGDYENMVSQGSVDAIIAEFNYSSFADKFELGNAKNLGGVSADYFYGVKNTLDGGFIVAGMSAPSSFDTGDWIGFTSSGELSDSVIVKYDSQFNVVWKSNFGGNSSDRFTSATAMPDGGYWAVGNSSASSFNTRDWAGITTKGNSDIAVVKYSKNGGLVWQQHFGGPGADDVMSSVNTPDDGIVMVGNSAAASFGFDDFATSTPRGNRDATIIKLDSIGNIQWAKNFGGSGDDYFLGVTTTSDGGYVATGFSASGSFGNGDWTGVDAIDTQDGIIVKFDANGNVIWKKNFASNYFIDVASTYDNGFVTVGYSSNELLTFIDDWTGFTAKGANDAIIVKYDADGDIVWKNNFGGANNDIFYGVGVRSNGDVVVLGESYPDSFGNGDWTDFTEKGNPTITYAVFSDIKVHKVEFMKYSNNDDVVIQTETVMDGDVVDEEDVITPDRIGFIFDGWYATNTTGMDKGLTVPFDFDAPITSDIRVWAKWTPVLEQLTLNWYDGIKNNTRSLKMFDTWIVDLTAEATNTDGNFQYWTITTGTKDAEIFSYERVISFSLTESMTLTAVYAQAPAPAQGIILLIDDESMEKDYGVANKVDISFFGDMVIPSGITLVEKGFIGSYYNTSVTGYNRTEANFTLGANYITKVLVPGPTRKSQATFKNVVKTWQYASRAFITYIDTDSVERTVYSNIIIRTP